MPNLLRASNASSSHSSGDFIITIPKDLVVPLFAGGGVLVLLIVVLLCYCYRRARLNQENATEREAELAKSLLHGAVLREAMGVSLQRRCEPKPLLIGTQSSYQRHATIPSVRPAKAAKRPWWGETTIPDCFLVRRLC